MSEFYVNRDLGDETDFRPEDVYRQQVMEFLLEDPSFREQLVLSSRIVAQEATLPAEMVAEHRAVLNYWGHLLRGTEYPLNGGNDGSYPVRRT